MDQAKQSLNRFVLDPANHDVLSLVKAIRNGLVYGTKIRFPHALVMVLLFRTGTIREKALAVYKATRQHALNLATFALTYKSIMLLLRHLNAARSSRTMEKVPRPASEPSFHSFISGLAAGYYVFGRRKAAYSSVNQQIVIYVFARVVLGAAKLAIAPTAPRSNELQAGYGEVRKGGMGLLDLTLDRVMGVTDWDTRERIKGRVRRDSWAVFASVSWGAVMWLFRWHPDVLQPSLRGSMIYLYDRAEEWEGVRDWIWHNR